MGNKTSKLHSSTLVASEDYNETQLAKLDKNPSLQKDENDVIVIVASSGDLVGKLGLTQGNGKRADSPTASVISSVSDAVTDSVSTGSRELKVKNWNGQKYSDLVQEGLRYLGEEDRSVIMLYETPSSSSRETSFFNCQVFNYHDFPKGLPFYKTVMAPLRYGIMGGSSYHTYLRDPCPVGLIEHWQETIPDYEAPTFSSKIDDYSKVYTYLPVEQISFDKHVIDPHIHYHLAGKDAINLMTHKTTRLLPNTKDERPCVAKVTHAMGSKGIFVIRSDEDEQELNQFLCESGHPKFVVTEFVNIKRNVACHFFVHPNGDITWVGSNENVLLPDGSWSTDSTIIMSEQEQLKEMQLPYVQDFVQYARQIGFWGFCGCDVLFDDQGKGYLVDVNPRVTGTSPALMIAKILKDKYGYGFGLFRRSGRFQYRGPAKQLLLEIREYNRINEGKSRVVLHAYHEKTEECTAVNLGVYGHSLESCEATLNRFAPRRQQVS